MSHSNVFTFRPTPAVTREKSEAERKREARIEIAVKVLIITVLCFAVIAVCLWGQGWG